MGIRRDRAALIFAVGGLIASCEARDSDISIGQHQFRVPPEHFVDEPLPWLPKPEKDSFLFRLFPSSQKNVTILVQEATRDCPEQRVCNLTDIDSVRGKQIEKILSREGDTQWTYVVREGRRRIDVARCFYSEGMYDALCSTLVLYGDLTLSIDFPDGNISEIVNVADTARTKLSEWEIN